MKKNLQNYDLANAYFQLEKYYNRKLDFINMQKYSELLKKYLKEDYYFLNIFHYNDIIINSLQSSELSNLENYLEDLGNYLNKYTPLKKDESLKLTTKNCKSFCYNLSAD